MKNVKWFARGGGVAKCGPFDSQEKATDAMRLAKDPQTFPPDVFVWPETVANDVKGTRSTAR